LSKRELLVRAWFQIVVGVFGNSVKAATDAIANLLYLPGNLLRVLTGGLTDFLHLPGVLVTAFGLLIWQLCGVLCYVINPTTASDSVKASVPGWVVEMMASRDQTTPPPASPES